MNDEAAIRSVRAGDPDAFRVLVQRYQGPLFTLARSFMRGHDGVEDLVQEGFVRAFQALEHFDAERGTFRAWLYQIARNRCRDALRRREPPASPLVVEPAARPEKAPDSSARLDAALAALTPERRMAFELTVVHGLSTQEAAEVEQVSVGTIKSRSSRARALLRAALERTTRGIAAGKRDA